MTHSKLSFLRLALRIVIGAALCTSARAEVPDPAGTPCGTIPADPAALTGGEAPEGVPAADLRSAGDRAWTRGDFVEAASCWLAEARSTRASESGALELDALLRTGQALRASGRLAHAERAFRVAGERATAQGDVRGELRAMLGLGATYLSLGALEPAERALADALERGRHAADADLIAAIQNERGNLLSRAGRHDEALAAYTESETRAREHGDEALALRAGANAARAAVESGEAGALEEREARIGELVEEVGALPESQSKARLLVHLGRTLELLAQQQPEGRAATRSRAAETFGAAAEAAGQAGAKRTESFALGYQAQLYEADGRREEALELTRRAIFAAEVADAPDAIYRWQWQAGRLERAAGNTDAAIACYRHATAALNRLRAETGFPYAGAGDSFAGSVKPVYDELVDLLLVRASYTEDVDAHQALLVEARDTLEDLKAGELRDYFKDECVDAQRRASVESIPGAVIVYPIILPDRVELIVGDPSGLRSFVSEVKREDLDAEVLAFRRLLEKRTTNEYRAPARQLYEWLIQPIEGHLTGNEIDALVFVPGGSLRTIPMAALLDPGSGKFLIEKYPVAVTPGLTLTDPKRIDRERTDLLTAGLTEARQGFPALHYVGRELEASHQVFEGESLVDDAFVVPALQSELEQRQFGIVHIASHGEFGSSVDDSFLLTYDDRLPVGRLAELVGMTRFRGQPVQLLTLSACETAAGDDRAALGVAGVALRAGARSALATLWSINDEVSAELISEFYAQLGNPEVSRAQALQRAQLKILHTHRSRHPAYWSPFLLISSWL
jgi:CHAT domain-containing protein